MLKAVTCIDLTTLAGYINIVYICSSPGVYVFKKSTPLLLTKNSCMGGLGNWGFKIIPLLLTKKEIKYKSDIVFWVKTCAQLKRYLRDKFRGITVLYPFLEAETSYRTITGCNKLLKFLDFSLKSSWKYCKKKTHHCTSINCCNFVYYIIWLKPSKEYFIVLGLCN